MLFIVLFPFDVSRASEGQRTLGQTWRAEDSKEPTAGHSPEVYSCIQDRGAPDKIAKRSTISRNFLIEIPSIQAQLCREHVAKTLVIRLLPFSFVRVRNGQAWLKLTSKFTACLNVPELAYGARLTR